MTDTKRLPHCFEQDESGTRQVDCCRDELVERIAELKAEVERLAECEEAASRINADLRQELLRLQEAAGLNKHGHTHKCASNYGFADGVTYPCDCTAAPEGE